MSKGTKFHVKRTYEENEQRVDVGFKASEVKFRIHTPFTGPFSLTEDEAIDLYNALSLALDEHEVHPLI